MICRNCRRSIFARSRSIHRRGVATAPATTNAAPSQPPPSTGSLNVPATSSAAPGKSQSLSIPFFPSTSTAKVGSASGTKELKKVKLQGSIPGGSELKGLAYLKAKPQVVAKEDDEYPAWLWSLLDEAKTASGTPAVDLAAMTKKQRAKYERRQERLMKDVPKPVPIHEQSKDLTGPDDNAITSLQKRQEVTKSSREARRKGIRENNFLRGM